jgi:putative ABC transport system substrate-binding protein
MLELFHAMVPQAESTAVLVNTLNPVHQGLWREADTAAPSLQMKLLRVEMRGSAGLDEAFDAIAKQHPSALFVLPDDATFNLRARIIEFVNNQRLPSLFGFREFVEDGGLMSYGRNFADSYRQSAAYVDKVVHGVNPATLPIEQPTTFELVINLKAARALGLTVPQSILLRADKVIE